jgi:pimeloyl-ACP methyl ester carboxylesterase
MFQYTSIKSLSLFIANKEQNLDTGLLVDIGKHDERNPIIFSVPGVASLANDFTALAKELNQQGYNMKAFNHKGLLDESMPYLSIEENVIESFEEILKNQRVGPYTILGHSYGGVIAFEIVKMLIQQGYEAKLVLLDTYFEQDSLKNFDDKDSVDYNLKEADADFLNKIKSIYSLQSELFSTYKPEPTANIIPDFIFAQNSVVDVKSYSHYLGLLFLNGFNASTVAGDHFSMLTASGANEISMKLAN